MDHNQIMELIGLLSLEGYEPRAYSGRGMFGKYCVGANIACEEDLWEIAIAAKEADIPVKRPLTDSLGRGMIAYWPSIPWPKSRTDGEGAA